MLFTDSAPPPRRITPFAGSAAVHCILVALAAFWSVTVRHSADEPSRPAYSLRFIHLQMPREGKAVTPDAKQPGTEGLRAALDMKRAQASPAAGSLTDPSQAASLVARAPAASPEHRQFRLPSRAYAQPVKQTLVQTDVPPEIVLKREAPLPTLLLWTQEAPTPFRKKFIAPAVKAVPKLNQQLPLAPVLESPNREPRVADLNIATALPSDMPRLVRPAAKASPVAAAGQEPPKEIPQIGLDTSIEPIPANVIALSDTPTRPVGMLALPPANQIASGGDPGGGETGSGSSTGAGKSAAGTAAAASGANGTGPAGDKNSGAGSGISGDKSTLAGGAGAAGNGSGRSGLSGRGPGGGPAGQPGGTGSAEGMPASLPGTTRLTLPKDGKFGVVVLGSSGAAPYPESVGALSGKVVYTVYLKVGLRKSWILQYCLPSAAERFNSTKGGTPPLAAPWPFLMLRPDGWSSSDPDYIMIHGMLTSAGEFDQLAMVFPNELERKDLILKSLKLWAFRPAARDGEPVAVEVLLIIPNEAE